MSTTPYGLYINFTSSTLVVTGRGLAAGVIINSHTSGTLKLWANTSATATVLCNTMTLGASERFVPLYGAEFIAGLFATVGGTADLTLVYNKGN